MENSIGIVEDDPGYRNHLMAVLGPERTRAWPSAETFLSDAAGENLSLLCIDLHLPHMSGIDLVRKIKSEGRSTPCLVISSIEAEGKIVEAIEAGAMGFVYKTDDVNLCDAIETVMSGGAVASSTIMVRLVHSLQRQHRDSWRDLLSERELQVVDLLLEARGRAEVAQLLGTSEMTVKNQIASIYKKLHVSNRMGLLKKVRGDYA